MVGRDAGRRLETVSLCICSSGEWCRGMRRQLFGVLTEYGRSRVPMFHVFAQDGGSIKAFQSVKAVSPDGACLT